MKVPKTDLTAAAARVAHYLTATVFSAPPKTTDPKGRETFRDFHKAADAAGSWIMENPSGAKAVHITREKKGWSVTLISDGPPEYLMKRAT